MSLLLDALRQAEKNKAQAAESPTTAVPLSIKHGIEERGQKQPASLLSLIPHDTPVDTTDELVEIALIPPFDSMLNNTDGYQQGLDDSAIAPASPKAPTVGALPPASMQSSDSVMLADAATAELADEVAAFFEFEQNGHQTYIAEQANDAAPGHIQSQGFAIEQAANVTAASVSESESASPATPEQVDSAQVGRHLAESVLLAAKKPTASKMPFILLGALAGLMTVAGYLYWLTLPPTPVYAVSDHPAIQSVGSESSASAAVEAPVNDAVVTATEDNPALEQEDPFIDPPLATPPLSITSTNQSNRQPKSAVDNVVQTPKVTKSSHTGTDDFIVESPDPIIIKVQQQPPRVEANLHHAYQLFQQQNYVAATRYYQQVLQDAPNNVDALLGMGAVAEQLGDKATADSYYKKVQALDNGNVYAGNALVRLEQSQFPSEKESGYKSLLEKSPDTAQTHAELGNLYAEQERWSEAQQAYFNAVDKAPDNAEYTYNLAVSLDHLEKAAIARRYYQRALQLAKGRQVSFDSASVYLRLQQLPEQ